MGKEGEVQLSCQQSLIYHSIFDNSHFPQIVTIRKNTHISFFPKTSYCTDTYIPENTHYTLYKLDMYTSTECLNPYSSSTSSTIKGVFKKNTDTDRIRNKTKMGCSNPSKQIYVQCVIFSLIKALNKATSCKRRKYHPVDIISQYS